MFSLIIFIGMVLAIVAAIGRNSTDGDYDCVHYHLDWDKEYHKWKLRGASDSAAHANSLKEVQKNKKQGKYKKYKK